MPTVDEQFIIHIMRNNIICAAFILLEIIVCESREPSLIRNTDGYNLHGGGADEDGMKARRRKRETGMAEILGGESAATAGEKGTYVADVTLVTIIITHERGFYESTCNFAAGE